MQVLGIDVLKKLMDKDTNKTATAEKDMAVTFQKLPIKHEQTDSTPAKTKSVTKPTETPRIRIKTEKEMRLPAPAPVVQQTQPTRRKPLIKNRQMFDDDDIGADMEGGLMLRIKNKPSQLTNSIPEINSYKPGPSSVKAAMGKKSTANTSMQRVVDDSHKIQSVIQKFVPTQTLPNNAGVVPIGM